MENLTKENFWNEMQQKYPLAMKDFCNWIDEYKKTNNWKKLFNDTYHQTNVKRAGNGEICSIDFSTPKFHDLPIAMQMGIWNEYLDVNSSSLQKCQNDIEIFLNATQEGMEEAQTS